MEDKSPAAFSMQDHHNQTAKDLAFAKDMDMYFENGMGTNLDKARNFAKFVPRQNLSLFLAKNELFKLITSVHGHIVECGVFLGGGLMTWAQLSAIYEPYNHIRRVVGFDTFAGFPAIDEKDISKYNTSYTHTGGLKADSELDIREAIRLYDLNRPIGHIDRVELVPGDASITIPDYLKINDHTIVAMLYLDFDLYEPTKIAIKSFLPRMPKGAIIAFDELNQKQWPGETRALLDTIGINNLSLKRFSYTPQLSYGVLD
jgi:hypothetical protein